MTFSDILSAAYADLGYQSSPASEVVTRIKRHVNQGLRVILGDPALSRLNDSDSPYTFATTASQARYVIPEAASKILHVTERTNDHHLEVMSLAEYRRREPDPASITGTPTHVVPIGRVAVATQPSDASSLFVDSTSASDTGTAYIEGLITGGYRRTSSVTMTGTTAVDLASTISSWIQVEDFYLSANAVGTVTLHEDSGAGTELARITIGQKRPRYYGFYLWPTPAAAVTYYVDYRKELAELVNDTDEPPLPTDSHYLLVTYARLREYEQKDDLERRLMSQREWERGLSALKYAVSTLSDEIPVAGRGQVIGRSRLGAYYPADTWSR